MSNVKKTNNLIIGNVILDLVDDEARELIDTLRSDVESDIADIRSDVSEDIADIRSDVESDISVIDARVDNLVTDVNGAETVTLWNGSMSTDGGTYTLSQSVANFDFIDIYYDNQYTGVADYLRIPASKTSAAVYIPFFETASGSLNKPLEIGKVALTFSGTSVTVAAAKQWWWDGTNEDNATIMNAQISFPVRIDGVRSSASVNAELADVRVGADGTTYASAGAAVRGQINDRFDAVASINLANPNNFTNGAIQSDGTISAVGSYANYSTTELIHLEANSDYTVSYWINGALYSSRIIMLLYSDGTTPVQNTFVNQSGIDHITFNSGSYKYARFAVQTTVTGVNSVTMQVQKGTEYSTFYEYYKYNVLKSKLGQIPIDQIDKMISPVTNELLARINEISNKNLIVDVEFTDGYMNQNGEIVSTTSYKYSDPISVTEGETLYTGKLRFVTYFTGNVYVSGESFSSSAETTHTLSIPLNVDHMVVTIYANDENPYVRKNSKNIFSGKSIDEIESLILSNINKLNGKILYNFGDSIGAGDGNGGTGYAEMLQSMFGTVSTDYAIGGATLSKISGQSMSSILDQIDNANTLIPDIILLEGGANDYTQFREMGNVSGEMDFANNWNTETYIGALESALYKLQTKYPSAIIIWIYTHRENTRNEKTNGTVTVNFTRMHDLSLEVCKKWAVPVIDLYNDGGLNTNWEDYRTAYTLNGDGTHPNETGYKRFYIPKIVDMIKKLLPYS